MNDFYTEQLVYQRPTTRTYAFKILLIVLTVISFLAMTLIPVIGTMFFVVMLLVDFYCYKNMDLEFEYLYVNGELDIDKIMGKQKRKRIFSTSIKELEVIAPQGHDQLRCFRPTKTVNCSSMIQENKKYEMIISQHGQQVKVIFEPNATILEGMKMLAPRKVFF